MILPSTALLLSYEEAARTVLEHAERLTGAPPKTEKAALLDCLGRVLAQPVSADRDQPPFRHATCDGFACHASNLAPANSLKIVGRLHSGQSWYGSQIGRGEAIEIMTGAPVPEGLDCVVMVEHATVRDGYLLPDPDRTWSAGENIVPQGVEAKAGSAVIASGTRIQPQHIAAAAACGRQILSIYSRPRVAILSTGDELVPLEQTPHNHQVRNSNSFSLAAQVTALSGQPVIQPIAPDQLAAVERAIRRTLSCELLLLSGGAATGKYDFVEQALANLGAEFFFTGVRMQPGKTAVFGRIPAGVGYRYFLVLPGNPISAMITFALFAGPLLGALSGRTIDACLPDYRSGMFGSSVEAKAELTRFLPARSIAGFDGTRVRLRPWPGSGDIAVATESNCFVVVPDGRALSPSDIVSTLHL